MIRFAIVIISLFSVMNLQGQKQRMDFSELLTDMECLSNIVKNGLKTQNWDLNQLMAETDSCSNYIAIRKFELRTDTLIITRIENQESSKIMETRLTIENDSLVIARSIPKEPIDFSKGKTGKLLTKDELEKLSDYISIRFIYDGQKMKVDFFSDLKMKQND